MLVLLHGITSTPRAWREVMPRLAERYTVIAPDMIGHGRSAKPRGDYSLGAYAAGVRDLLAVLGFERGTVVGHSFGGGIAMQFAYLFPEYVERMALISSGGLGREVHPLLRAATLPGSEWVLPLIAREWPVRAGDAVRSVAAKLGLEAGPDLAEFARGYASLTEEGAREAFLHTMRGVIDPERPAGLRPRPPLPRRPACPTLIVWGDDDPVIPVEHGRNADRVDPQQPLRGDRGLRPLADARRSGADRPRADRIHGGDRAVRVRARAHEGSAPPGAHGRLGRLAGRRRLRLVADIRKQISDAASVVTVPAALTRNVGRATDAIIDIRDQLAAMAGLPRTSSSSSAPCRSWRRR